MAPLIEPPSRRPRIALSTSAPPCSGTCSSCPDSLRPSSSRVSWLLPATSVTRAEASTTLTVPAYQCDDVVGSGAVWAGRPGDDPADDLLAGGAGGEFCQPCCHVGGQRHARAGGPGLQRGGHLVGKTSYLQGTAHSRDDSIMHVIHALWLTPDRPASAAGPRDAGCLPGRHLAGGDRGAVRAVSGIDVPVGAMLIADLVGRVVRVVGGGDRPGG